MITNTETTTIELTNGEITALEAPKTSAFIERPFSAVNGQEEVIREATEFFASHGVEGEDLAKVPTLFSGANAFCVLHTSKIHICSVNAILTGMEIRTPRLEGHMTPRVGNVDTNIALRKEGKQNLFLVGYERIQSAKQGQETPGKFWGFSLVCFETEGVLPLSVTLDLFIGSDQKTYVMRFSRSVYFTTRTVGTERVQFNRLKDLHGHNNLQEMLANVAYVASFPLQGARPFPTRDFTSSNARNGSFDRPAPAATSTEQTETGGSDFSDPFAG